MCLQAIAIALTRMNSDRRHRSNGEERGICSFPQTSNFAKPGPLTTVKQQGEAEPNRERHVRGVTVNEPTANPAWSRLTDERLAHNGKKRDAHKRNHDRHRYGVPTTFMPKLRCGGAIGTAVSQSAANGESAAEDTSHVLDCRLIPISLATGARLG